MTEQKINEELRQQILSYFKLDDHWLDRLVGAGEILRFRKKEAVVEQDRFNNNIYLIIDGIWRAYFDSADMEKTMYFAVPGEAVFSSSGYFDSGKSFYSIESSTESIAWSISRKQMTGLIDVSEEVSHWFINILGKIMLLTEQSIVDMSTLLAGDRYRTFALKMPYVLQNVPLKEIAAYLGVTPQSLSRIRSEIVKK